MYYVIHRKNDGYRIKSKNITLINNGVWVKDDLVEEAEGLLDIGQCKVFIPYHNISQIVEYNGELVVGQKG